MKIDRSQMLDMAMNMLAQAKISQQSIEKIVENNEIALLGFGDQKGKANDSAWARHIYNIVRGAVGLLEINTSDIQALSEMGSFEVEEAEDDD